MNKIIATLLILASLSSCMIRSEMQIIRMESKDFSVEQAEKTPKYIAVWIKDYWKRDGDYYLTFNDTLGKTLITRKLPQENGPLWSVLLEKEEIALVSEKTNVASLNQSVSFAKTSPDKGLVFSKEDVQLTALSVTVIAP